MNEYSAEVKINPPPSTFVASGDSLLIVRPNGLPGNKYSPAKAPATPEVGNWTATDYVRASYDEAPMGKESSFNRAAAMTGTLFFISNLTLSFCRSHWIMIHTIPALHLSSSCNHGLSALAAQPLGASCRLHFCHPQAVMT